MSLEKPVIYKSEKRNMVINVMHVFRANFNDTYYLEDYTFDLDELYKDELVWFDPYLGRSKINDTKVAISYVSDDNMNVLVDDGKSIKEENVDGLRECILCEDCDESRMLASHISFRR